MSTVNVDVLNVSSKSRFFTGYFTNKMLTKLALRKENPLVIKRELYNWYLEVYRLINCKQKELIERMNKDQEYLEQAETEIQININVEDLTTAAIFYDRIEYDKRKIFTELQKISDEIKAIEEEDDTNFLA